MLLPICQLFLIALSFCGSSGFANNNIIKALDGQRVGTLFHREAIKWASIGDFDAREMAVSARECARRLQVLYLEDI